MRSPLAMFLTLGLYLWLSATTVNHVGLVGEVGIGWTTARAPHVLVQASPPLWAGGDDRPTAGDRRGPLVASQVRPVEALELGPLSLPLAINSYTGGLPDWPARLLYALTGSLRALTLLHVLLGAWLIVGVRHFLRIYGTEGAANAGGLLLASAWGFVFYKKVLGGTEIALQAGVLLSLWALWDRRWTGGRRGLWMLGVGLALGLAAKVTFVLSLGALLMTALLTRWDRPTLGPPPRQRWLRPALLVGVALLPLGMAWAHHALAVPTSPHIVSHDFPQVQWSRVSQALSAKHPAREGLGNLGAWLGDPLSFFARAYDATPTRGWSPFGVVGWLLVLTGAALAWRDRHPTPRLALLRFTGIFLVLQVGVLLLVARDLHHLAQALPTLAITGGLALDHLASQTTPPRGRARLLLATALALPWVVDGVGQLRATDPTVDTVRVPTFTRAGQAALVDLLRDAGVERLVACDYELYGVLEVLTPDLRVEHGWGAVSQRRGRVLPGLLERAAGAHLLVLRASAPMIYNLRPSGGELRKAGAALDLDVVEVGRLPEDGAVLYAVQRTQAE